MTDRSDRRRWLLGCTLGIAVGLPLGLVVGAPFEALVGAMLVTPLMLALSGALVGTSQWALLRRGLVSPGRWIGLSALGFAAGFTLAVVLVEVGGEQMTGAPVRMSTTGTVGLLVSVAVIGLVGGGIAGFVQSFAFDAGEVTRGRWAARSAVGLAAGFCLGIGLAALVGGPGSAAGLALFLVVGGALYGAVTGRVLAPAG